MKKKNSPVSNLSLIVSSLLLLFGFQVRAAEEFPEPPTEVQNVVATAGDKTVQLTWDAATDPDGVVVGYKVYYGVNSVQGESERYDSEVSVEDVTSYTLQNLSNGVQYFIALTAVDDEAQESDTYSPEVSATPEDPYAPYPKIMGASQVSDTEVQVTFSESVVLDDPEGAFVMTEEGTGNAVTVSQVSVQEHQVLLTLGQPLAFSTRYQITATDKVADTEENTVQPGIMDQIEFTTRPEPQPEPIVDETHPAATEQDSIAPLEVQNLLIDTDRLESEGVVLLQWQAAPDPDSDLADQMLYTKRGTEAWDAGYSLGLEVNEIELEVDYDQNYEVRVATVDKTGNESEGKTISFSTHLSKTGPGSIGTVVALSLVFFVGLIAWGRRKAY